MFVRFFRIQAVYGLMRRNALPLQPFGYNDYQLMHMMARSLLKK